MDFMVGTTAASRLLVARWGTELAVAGITADSLPDDIDARHNVIGAALAGSTAFSVTNLVRRRRGSTKWPTCCCRGWQRSRRRGRQR